MSDSERLFLLDGMALVYRAHFAFIRNPIRNSKGVNTSAVFGFTNTLLDLLQKHPDAHIALVFDTEAPTFRHEEFSAYKAQRDEMPEELRDAIPAVKRLAKAFGLPVIELDGYEADDIIGTLARRAESEGGWEVFMVTPDKDFAQLVTGSVKIWKPGRQGGEVEILGVDEVKEQWQVADPARVADVLALWGDASDNIPGVPGVGEKTAKKLIAEHGTLEDVLAAAPGIKGKLGEALAANTDQARLCLRLATIQTDVPLEIAPEDVRLSPRNDEELKSLFAEFEFNSIGRRVFGRDVRAEARAASAADGGGLFELEPQGGEGGTFASASEQGELFASNLKTMETSGARYERLEGAEDAAALAETLAALPRFAFDTETTGLDSRRAGLLGIAFAWQPGHAVFLIVPREAAARAATLDALRPAFAGPALKAGQNLKYDLAVLLHHGVEVAGPYFDTMLAHALVFPDQRHGMDAMAESLLGYLPQSITALIGPKGPQQKNMEDVLAESPEVVVRYAGEDADITLQLADKLEGLLEESGQGDVFHRIECPLLPVLVAMEAEGIRVDAARLQAIGRELESIADELREKVMHEAGVDFNLNSPRQLGEVLFGRLQLLDKPKKTKTGQYVTNEQVLSELAPRHPIVGHVLDYREATKLKSTYVDALPTHIHPQSGRVHTHFHQMVAATGRMASSDPNLQNIPVRTELGRGIRDAFVPRGAGYLLLCADYSQIELRVMASLSGDAGMREAFAAGEDIHTATAARVFRVPVAEVTSEMRRQAKMVNFGIIYGISAFGLSQRLGIPRGDAARIIDSYFESYPGVRGFMDRAVREATENGYTETLTGRRRPLPDLRSGNQNIRSAAERMAINTPIQGSAADMIKLAMIKVHHRIAEEKLVSRLLLQVHDELVFDMAEEEEQTMRELVTEAMTTALPLEGVSLVVDLGIGESWLDAH